MKTLYLLPGTVCNEQLWSLLAPYLANQFKLVFLPVPTGKSMAQLADFYNDNISEPCIHLVGFSMGGYIATYFAAKYPERVKRLFIIANSSVALAPFEIKKREAAMRFIAAGGVINITQKQLGGLFDKPKDNAHLVTLAWQMVNAHSTDELLSQYRNTSYREDLSDVLNGLNIPIQFYYSDCDPLVNVEWFKQFTATANITITSTPGSSHMLPLEKPAELANHLLNWGQFTTE